MSERKPVKRQDRGYPKPGSGVPLLYMTVDVGRGQHDGITVFPEDEPAALAAAFCSRMGLAEEAKKQLEGIIAEKKASATDFRTGRNLDSRSSIPSQRQRLNRSETHFLSSSSLITRSESSDRHSVGERTPRNYGEWLYTRGQQGRKQRLMPEQRTHSERRLGLHRCRKQRPRSCSISTEDNLLQKGEESSRRLKVLRDRALEDEMVDCTFRPEVNPISRKLNRSESPSSCFDRLSAKDSRSGISNSRQSRTSLQPDCSFHPATISSRKKPETQTAMVNRLLHSKQNFDSVVSKLREELEAGQQPSFKPITGRAPASGSRHGPIHERLYEQRRPKDTRQKSSRESSTDSSRPKSSKSDRIYEDFRKRQITALFNKIDGDKDGMISLHRPEDLQGVDSRTALLLGPVWRDLLSSRRSIGLEQFVSKVDSVLKSLSQEEKNHILKRAGSAEATPETVATPQVTPRQPVISKASELLATRRREKQDKDVYSRRVKERSASQERVKLMKQQKEAAELQECTFKPALTRYKRALLNPSLL